MLSVGGELPNDQDQARSLIRELDRGITQQDYLSSVSFAKNHSDSSGRVGCVSFCWGGGMAIQLAVNSTEFSCSVSFYRSQVSAEDAPKMKITLVLHYAGLDERINKGIPEFINVLTVNAAPFTMHMYPGVNHTFHNETNGARFDQDSAKLAWQRTVAFWNHYIKI
ncbi:MAG: dienelactone hydrolase family protein [SAR324 cluster bacterium]|nr:dienelactone hydrolase family protein [SAR324 cluster bacterium]